MLPLPRRIAAPLALAGALGTLLCAGSAQAQVILTPTATFTGSSFHYTYSITSLVMNTDPAMPTELAIVNLSGLPTEADTATNLAAPTGFQTTFDAGTGFLSFSPTTPDPASGTASGTFVAGVPVSGFSFDSIFSPATVTYDALDSAGNDPGGTTLGPAGAPVPEASTLVSLGAGLVTLTFFAARRRRTASVSL